MLLRPSRENPVFPIPNLFSFSSEICAVIISLHNFPGWQQLAPQTIGNTEAQRDSGVAEEPAIQQGMKDFFGICDRTARRHCFQVLWTLAWYWWLGLEDGCQQLDNAWRASVSDRKTYGVEVFTIFLSFFLGGRGGGGGKDSSYKSKRLGIPGKVSQAISQSSAPPDLGTVSLTGDSCCRQPCGETACCSDSSGITLNGLVCPLPSLSQEELQRTWCFLRFFMQDCCRGSPLQRLIPFLSSVWCLSEHLRKRPWELSHFQVWLLRFLIMRGILCLWESGNWPLLQHWGKEIPVQMFADFYLVS